MKSLDEVLGKTIPGPNGCIDWNGSLTSGGYGNLKWEGRTVRAHRLVFQLMKGPIQDGLVVMHSCDRPVCVNPDHLSVGTMLDNCIDRDSKQRGGHGHTPGELHGCSKLTESQVIEMRKLRATGDFTYYQLGEMFGVAYQTAHKACSGTTWCHL